MVVGQVRGVDMGRWWGEGDGGGGVELPDPGLVHCACGPGGQGQSGPCALCGDGQGGAHTSE